jgi:hypothetical protein
MTYAHHLWKRMFLSNRRRMDRIDSKQPLMALTKLRHTCKSQRVVWSFHEVEHGRTLHQRHKEVKRENE